ncbi:MAG: PAS domain-containing protein [Planctomycetota bacterium]
MNVDSLDYRKAVRAFPTPLYQYDITGRIIWANDAALSAFGTSQHDIQRKYAWQLVEDIGDQRDQARRRVTAKLSGDRLPDRGLLVPLLLHGGQSEVFAVHDVIIRDERSRIQGVQTFLNQLDTTSLLRSELPRFSATWSEELARIPQIYVLRKDCAGTITYANLNYRNRFHSGRSTPVGKTDADLFPAELAVKYRADDIALVRGLVPGDVRQEFETFRPKHESEDIRVHVIKSLVRNEDGDPSGVQVMFWPVSRAQQSLRRLERVVDRSQEAMMAFLSESPIGIYRCTREGAFELVNTAFASMLGYDDSARFADLNMERDVYYDPKDRPRNVRDLRARREGHGRTICFKHRDGQPVWVSVSARVVLREGVEYFEGWVVSATKQRKHQEQFGQWSRMQAAGMLAGDIAHELSNGFTGCFGELEACVAFIHDSSYAEAILCATRTEKYLKTMRGYLDDLGSIEASESSMRAVRCEVGAVVRDALKAVNLRGVRIHPRGDDLRCAAQQRLLVRAVRNLVDNAVEASLARNGVESARVEVCWKKTVESVSGIAGETRRVGRVRIDVIDNGVGLSQGEENYVWDRRWTKKEGHVGMGLFWTRLFVQGIMGGEVMLEDRHDASGCVATILVGVGE